MHIRLGKAALCQRLWTEFLGSSIHSFIHSFRHIIALGWFATKCEAAGVRISTSECKAMVLDLIKSGLTHQGQVETGFILFFTDDVVLLLWARTFATSWHGLQPSVRQLGLVSAPMNPRPWFLNPRGRAEGHVRGERSLPQTAALATR